MAHKFKSGDLVKLKTGSQSMTIKGFAFKHTDQGNIEIADKYECFWSDGSKSQKAIFREEVLELV